LYVSRIILLGHILSTTLDKYIHGLKVSMECGKSVEHEMSYVKISPLYF
jgi:hypothetical protein